MQTEKLSSQQELLLYTLGGNPAKICQNLSQYSLNRDFIHHNITADTDLNIIRILQNWDFQNGLIPCWKFIEKPLQVDYRTNAGLYHQEGPAEEDHIPKGPVNTKAQNKNTKNTKRKYQKYK